MTDIIENYLAFVVSLAIIYADYVRLGLIMALVAIPCWFITALVYSACIVYIGYRRYLNEYDAAEA